MRLDWLSYFNRSKRLADTALQEAKAAKDEATTATAKASTATAAATNAMSTAKEVAADIRTIKDVGEMPAAPGKSVELNFDEDTGYFMIRREGDSDDSWIRIQVQGPQGKPGVVISDDIQAVIDQQPERFRGPGPTPQQIADAANDYIAAHAADFKGKPGDPGAPAIVKPEDIQTVIDQQPDRFKGEPGKVGDPGKQGEPGKTPTREELTALINSVIASNPAAFKGQPGDPATAAQINTALQEAMAANPAAFRGPAGKDAVAPYVTSVSTGSNGLATVTFPSGRFTKVPRIIVQPYSPSADAFIYFGEVMESTTSPTVNGCNIRVRRQPMGIISSVINLVMNDEPKKAITAVVVAYDQ